MRNMCSNLDASKLTLTSCLALSAVWRYTIQKLQIWGIIWGSSTVQQSFAKSKARKERVAGQHVLKLLLQQHDLPLKLVEASSLLDWCYCKTGRLWGLTLQVPCSLLKDPGSRAACRPVTSNARLTACMAISVRKLDCVFNTWNRSIVNWEARYSELLLDKNLKVICCFRLIKL